MLLVSGLLALTAPGCGRSSALEAFETLPAIDAEGLSELRIVLGRGSAVVEPCEGPRVEITARKFATASTEDVARKRLLGVRLVASPEADGVMRVSASGSEGNEWGIDVTARIPSELRTSVETQDGCIRVSGLTGSVRAWSRRGDVHVDAAPRDGSRLEMESELGSVRFRVPRFLAATYHLRSEGGVLRTESAPFRVPPGATSFSTTTGVCREPTTLFAHARGGDVIIEGG